MFTLDWTWGILSQGLVTELFDVRGSTQFHDCWAFFKDRSLRVSQQTHIERRGILRQAWQCLGASGELLNALAERCHIILLTSILLQVRTCKRPALLPLNYYPWQHLHVAFRRKTDAHPILPSTSKMFSPLRHLEQTLIFTDSCIRHFSRGHGKIGRGHSPESNEAVPNEAQDERQHELGMSPTTHPRPNKSDTQNTDGCVCV